ncbi:MAG: acetyl-CoA acetyltransferase [Pseudomonadota bacterium]
MADLHPHTPVLVGVAAVQQKEPDFERALEPVDLMARALQAAAEDAGSLALLQRADEIQVPKGMWHYSDPARLVADKVGAVNARTVLAEIGVLQQSMMTRACQAIQSGEADIMLVVGGEAKYRGLCAAKAGAEAKETEQTDAVPDETLLPDDEIWDIVESATGLGMPVGFYAIIDSALRFRQGLSVDQHRDQMAAMYQRFSEVATRNPDAWSDTAVAAEDIREGSPRNRMLAFPYTKLHNSQWNVDQAAGLVFCSLQTAQSLGIPREKWLFPRASTESNFMSVVTARKDLGGSPGFRLAGQRAMDMAGIDFDDITLRELYSCFPSAVRVQLEEFGMQGDGDLTVMGGMTFGGGPLNNFVLQATVRMGQLLRDQPSEVGLVTSVSGMLTKQACALWSTDPGDAQWAFEDVSDAVRAECELCEVVGEVTGPCRVAGYTVLYQGDEPWRAVAVFDMPDGRRTAAYSEAPAIIADMLSSTECCGREYVLAKGQFS